MQQADAGLPSAPVIEAFLKAHTVSTETTDFEGKAEFHVRYNQMLWIA